MEQTIKMEEYSHLIEIKKFMNKCLVCDIQVQDISISASGLNVQTNKWLHLEDWLGIDASIDKLLHPFRHSETLDGFETDNFHIGGAIRVDCKKKKISRSHVKILGADRVYLPFALDVQVTKINTKALMEQITHFEKKLKGLGKTENGTLKEEEKTLVQNENLREYDPTTNNIGMEQASNDYVPYKASVKNSIVPLAMDTTGSVLSENEPYSPKPVPTVESSPDQISESPNEIPTYKPARIGLNKNIEMKDELTDKHNDKKKDEQSLSTNLIRRRRSPIEASKSKTLTSPSRHHASKRRPSRKPKTMNAQLFGSDDSDQERLENPCKSVIQAPDRIATPLRTPSIDRLHKESKHKRYKLRHECTQQSPLDGWLSKGSLKQADKPSEKSLKKCSRHPPNADPKAELCKRYADERIKNEVELQLIDELTALNDKIKSKRKSPPPVMEMLTLTHLSIKDIFGTFEQCKSKLDDIFKKYSKKTKVTGFDGINHMKTIMLIDDKKQLKMMNFLRENYQPEEKGVPSLTDLYINALVPEWTINMFMKEYNFTRTEAIDRLHAQEESLVYHNEALDSSGPL